MSNQTNDQIANPAPLGLLAFGMTTILLNLHNAGVMPLTLVITAMGMALGGAAQIIAGVMEFKKGNTFGATAFSAYGLFWFSLVIIWANPLNQAPADSLSMGYYLLLWGIFTGCMFVGTLTHSKIIQIVFGSLTLLFFMLAYGDFTDAHGLKFYSGLVGIFCGASAMYASVGQIVNAELGRKVFPLI